MTRVTPRALGRAERAIADPTVGSAREVNVTIGIGYIESMLMTPGAQENELKRIDNDVHSFNTEIFAAAQSHGGAVKPPTSPEDVARFAHEIAAQPAAVANDPIVQLYAHVWAPFLETWNRFYADNKTGAWFSNPVSEGEKYQEQLIDIRAKAAELGMKVLSPAPKQEHPEGLPSWFVPAAAIGGGLVLLSILGKNS